MAADTLGPRTGRLISMEGVWGAGKTTNARRLAAHLTGQGFTATVLHDGLRGGFIGRLSAFLDKQPLRRRDGEGGYDHPHHATLDVLTGSPPSGPDNSTTTSTIPSPPTSEDC